MNTTLLTLRLLYLTAGGVTAPEEQQWEETGDEDGRVRNVLRLSRDALGRPHLPGSTVAGSLRAHCAAAPELATAFGPPPGRETAAVSPIQVLGTRLRGAPETTIATRTAIDRTAAAAHSRTLRATEQLPAGTEIDIYLRWDNPGGGELAALRSVLPSWRPNLGRGASVGAGRCACVGIGERTFNLAEPQGLLDWLQLSGPDDYPAPDQSVQAAQTDAVVRTYKASIVDGLHIGTGSTRHGRDGQQVATIARAAAQPIVPGSTMKGVLRSRTEYICRVLGEEACEDNACGQCRPCRLFGHRARDQHSRPGRAAIAIPDSPIEDAVCQDRQHVAIDRFTGGARHQLLFTHEVVVSGHFTITVEQLADTPLSPADIALLDMSLADLHEGLIGLGARTTAGYGTVRLRDADGNPPQPPSVAVETSTP